MIKNHNHLLSQAIVLFGILWEIISSLSLCTKCVYTGISDNTIIENIEIGFIQIKCDIGALRYVYSKRFGLIINSFAALNICMLI